MYLIGKEIAATTAIVTADTEKYQYLIIEGSRFSGFPFCIFNLPHTVENSKINLKLSPHWSVFLLLYNKRIVCIIRKNTPK